VRGKLDLLLLKFCLFEWILHPEIKDSVIIHLLSKNFLLLSIKDDVFLCVQWASVLFGSHAAFSKMTSFVFLRRKKCIQVWNHMRVRMTECSFLGGLSL